MIRAEAIEAAAKAVCRADEEWSADDYYTRLATAALEAAMPYLQVRQVIPEAAVEAAAAYVHEHFHGSPLYVYKDGYQQDYKDTIRHALELAAPFMLAEAWDEFMKGKWDPMQENPYEAAK